MTSTIFDLRNKSLKLETRADVEPHLAGVDPEVVEEIHLSGNTVGVEAAQALAEFLAKTTKLRVANFADIFTGRLITEIPQAIGALCDALVSKHTLNEIDLSDNAFGGRVVDPLVPFLSQNRAFSVLKLNNNGLGPEGGTVIAEALSRSAAVSAEKGEKSNLRVLVCGRNRLEDGSAIAWAKAFADHAGLEEVRMVQNGIRQAGIIALASGLGKNPNLRVLDLQDNAFNIDDSDEGSRAMANVLPLWPSLEELNFSDCVLANEEDDSPPAVIDTIAAGSNPKLHTLQLQNDNLDSSSFALLAEALPNNLPLLMRLEIQWNDVDEDEEAVLTLLDGLKARGGKLLVDDEDEDASDEEEDDGGEPEREAEKEETDELAAMMNKVSIADK